MNSAWNLVQAGDESADGLQILDYLAYSISQEGNHEQARNITLLLHENYPENTRYIDNIKYYDELEDVIHRPSSVSFQLKSGSAWHYCITTGRQTVSSYRFGPVRFCLYRVGIFAL